MPFQTEHFTVPQFYEETPLCDRKSEFPNLRHDMAKAEFLRDVIALANSARSFGKPARLLFGLNDKGDLVDISPSLSVYGSGSSYEHELSEKIRCEIGQALANYVEPDLHHFDFFLGEVDGKRVGYLLIPPLAPPQRFHVKKHLRSGKQPLLTAGQCWVRYGEHKAEVSPRLVSVDAQDAPYTYAYAEIPYILPSGWVKYFDHLLKDEQITKAQDIIGYQAPISEDGELVEQIVRDFLQSEHRVLVIQGLAGVGKTAFLRREVAKLASVNLKAMEEVQRREEFHGPSDWIPLWLSLRGMKVSDEKKLTEQVLDVVHKSQAFWAGQRPRHPEHLLEYSDLKWVICMDGLDEIWNERSQRRFLSALHTFTSRFPRVKVILTTRPEAVAFDTNWLAARVTTMAPFNREMVLNYIASHLREELAQEAFAEIETALTTEPDLLYLCTFPACLEAAMQELANAFPGPLLDEAVTTNAQIEALPAPENNVTTSPEVINDASLVSVSVPSVPVEDIVSRETSMPREASLEDNLTTTTSEPETSGLGIRRERVVDSIYQRLWQREVERNLVQPHMATERWNLTGRLALEMDGHAKACDLDSARKRLRSRGALLWLLNLGVLDRVRDSKNLSFRTETTKTYFAASYLQSKIEAKLDPATHKLYLRAATDFRDGIHRFLNGLTTLDLTQLEGGPHA